MKNKKEALQIERQIRELFISGREKKSRKDKWIEAIFDYKQAIEKTDELYEMCPTRVEYHYRLFMVTVGIATLAAFVINLFFLFKML